MIKMENYNNLNEFQLTMIEILQEKSTKYKDTWKRTELDYLRYKMKKQMKLLKLEQAPNRAMRRVIHIANYCYLIYQKLEDSYL